MNLKEVNEALNHRITSGSEFLWKCFPDGRYLDYESEFAYVSVIYNTATQEIYQAEASQRYDDTVKPYRWLNPEFKDAYYNEAKERNISPSEAWDDVKWVDLEVEEDFLEKATKMFEGQIFDTRIKIPIDLDDTTMLTLALEAHKRDITFNQLVEDLLQEVINSYKSTEVIQ